MLRDDRGSGNSTGQQMGARKRRMKRGDKPVAEGAGRLPDVAYPKPSVIPIDTLSICLSITGFNISLPGSKKDEWLLLSSSPTATLWQCGIRS